MIGLACLGGSHSQAWLVGHLGQQSYTMPEDFDMWCLVNPYDIWDFTIYADGPAVTGFSSGFSDGFSDGFMLTYL